MSEHGYGGENPGGGAPNGPAGAGQRSPDTSRQAGPAQGARPTGWPPGEGEGAGWAGDGRPAGSAGAVGPAWGGSDAGMMGPAGGGVYPGYGAYYAHPYAAPPPPMAPDWSYRGPMQPAYASPYPPPFPPMYGPAMSGPWPGHAAGDQSGAAHSGNPGGGQAQHGPGMADLVDEIASGGNGLSSLSKMLNLNDSEFWKGALIGAAVVLVLTNETVQGALFKGGAKAKAAVKSGVDRVKETVHPSKEAGQAEGADV